MRFLRFLNTHPSPLLLEQLADRMLTSTKHKAHVRLQRTHDSVTVIDRRSGRRSRSVVDRGRAAVTY